MKRVAAIVALGLAAIAIYAVTAPAGQQSVSPKQFAALSAKVTKLTKDLKVVESCVLVGAVPVARFGDAVNHTEGYVYVNPDKTQTLEPAIDLAAPNAAQAWILVTTPKCATALNGGRHVRLRLGTPLSAHAK
jgi:phage-related protein